MASKLDHIDTPAIVMTPTHDVLAWNPLAAALMVDFGEVPEQERNFVRLLFTDLRPRLAELVGDLSIRDAQFRQWWAGAHVAVKRRGTRRCDHPVVGEITLDWDALTSRAGASRARNLLGAWAGEYVDTA